MIASYGDDFELNIYGYILYTFLYIRYMREEERNCLKDGETESTTGNSDDVIVDNSDNEVI